MAAVPDPTSASQIYLYAAGGNSGTPAAPAPLSSVEVLAITVTGGGAAQTFAASWTAAQPLPSARWLAPALAGTGANNDVIPSGSSYLYVASGAAGALGALDRPVYAAKLGAAGALGAFGNAGSVGVNRAGFGCALVNNQMMAFGGLQTGAPQNNSDTAKLTSPTGLANFNSLGGGVLQSARALQGTAIESAFIYQLGGASTALGTAQATTEQAIW